jgi:hypothetical protein
MHLHRTPSFLRIRCDGQRSASCAYEEPHMLPSGSLHHFLGRVAVIPPPPAEASSSAPTQRPTRSPSLARLRRSSESHDGADISRRACKVMYAGSACTGARGGLGRPAMTFERTRKLARLAPSRRTNDAMYQSTDGKPLPSMLDGGLRWSRDRVCRTQIPCPNALRGAFLGSFEKAKPAGKAVRRIHGRGATR